MKQSSIVQYPKTETLRAMSIGAKELIFHGWVTNDNWVNEPVVRWVVKPKYEANGQTDKGH